MRYLWLLGGAATGVARPRRACKIIIRSINITGKEKLLCALSSLITREVFLRLKYGLLVGAGQVDLIWKQRLGRIISTNLTGFLLQTSWDSEV